MQVKGSSNMPSERWWIGYGHCNDRIIDKQEPMFNRRGSDRSYDVRRRVRG